MSAIRIAAHVHSDWSYDGRWPLAGIARAFRRRGYRAVLMAEHDRGFDEARWRDYRAACAAASTPRLLLVPGIEYSDPDDVVHLPTWGADRFLGAGRPTAETLRAARGCGAFTVLAHPARREAWRRLDAELLGLLGGVELWNRKYDGWAPSAVGARLADATGLPALAGLDFHSARQFAPLAMLADLDGPVAADAIVAALRAGRARPAALGVPAPRLARGLPLRAARGAERTRRRMGALVRRARALSGA